MACHDVASIYTSPCNKEKVFSALSAEPLVLSAASPVATVNFDEFLPRMRSLAVLRMLQQSSQAGPPITASCLLSLLLSPHALASSRRLFSPHPLTSSYLLSPPRNASSHLLLSPLLASSHLLL